MGIKIGLDIGGSTTKIIGMQDGKLIGKEVIKASDPVTCACGGLGKIAKDNNWVLEDIEQICITGVGSTAIPSDIFGIKTAIAPEFESSGLGGLYLAGLDKAVVVSMGTGTAFLEATKKSVKHIIGTGVGGGTMIGISKAMIDVSSPELIKEIAKGGVANHADLTVGDIAQGDVTGLPRDLTASNFGKAADGLSDSDKLSALFNMIYQSIGTLSVMASRNTGIKDVVYTGQFTAFEQCKKYLKLFEDFYGINVIVPEDATFATAIGSVLDLEA
ncbi:MAG: pantothenate kinase [Saccharofermentans sp.]|nr:pantothenate kinase [Saccharofermentans sp.]